MKKKTLLTAILSIVMCMSLMAGATFALFTSESTVNIAITSGKVDVVAVVDVDSVEYVTYTNTTWTDAVDGKTEFDGIGGSAEVTESSVKLNNITAGDGLKFNVVVKNNSTITVKARTIVENDLSKDTGLFNCLQVKIGDQPFAGAIIGDWEEIAVGSTDVIIPVEIVLPSSSNDQEMGCEINVVVEAVQGNANVQNSFVDNQDGTYTINDIHGLYTFARSVNGGKDYKGETVILANDIDLANTPWTPIGNTTQNYFKGTFDGQEKTISNLYINTPEDSYVGLFGYAGVSGAIIKDVKVKNVDIEGYSLVAAIVGKPAVGTKIINCHVSGDINITANFAYAGGISGGNSYADIDGCSVIADGTGYITGVEKGVVGGIAARVEEGTPANGNDITNSVAKNLEITGYANIGAITGFVHYNDKITGCTAENIKLTKTRDGGNASIGIAAGGWSYKQGTKITISNNTFTNIEVNGNYLANAAWYEGVGLMFGSEYYGSGNANDVFEIENNTLTNITDNRYVRIASADDLTNASAVATTNIGTTLGFVNDIVGDSILDQKANVNVVVDGKGYKYTGTMDIYGHAGANNAETLTIKNVNFVSDVSDDFISCNTTDPEKRYAHNITVEDCTFTGTTENGVEVVGMRFRQCYNITVKNCTANGLHSLMWATGVSGDTGISFENIVMEDCLNGISIGTSIKASFKNVSIEASEPYSYGIRADFSGAYELTIEDCDITAAAPVLLRKATGTSTATFVGNNTLTANNATTNANGYQIFVVAGDFDDGKDVNGETVAKATIVNGDAFNTFKSEGIIKKFKVGGTEYSYTMSEQMANSVVMNSSPTYPQHHDKVEKIDIYTAADMVAFRQMCADGVFTAVPGTGWYATLNMMADIDWDWQDWTGMPVKNLIWNANGHKLSNLNIIYTNTVGQAGLFDKANNIVINDLTVENATVKGSQAGVFFGNAETCKLNNCKLAGNITINWVSTSEEYNAIGSAVGCFSSGNDGMNILQVSADGANIVLNTTGISYPNVPNTDSNTEFVGKLYNGATFND